MTSFHKACESRMQTPAKIMLFWYVLVLTAQLGMGIEYDCDSRGPECLYRSPVPEEDVEAHTATGNLFPSNEFFQKVCGGLIENAKCTRDYVKVCPAAIADLDWEAAVKVLTEFCDEESTLRKGYEAHVDCANRMKLTSQACFLSYRSTVRQLEDEKFDDYLKEKGIKRACLALHLLKPCTVDSIRESCGEDAGKTAAEIMSRIESVVPTCSENDGTVFEEVLEELTLRTSDK